MFPDYPQMQRTASRLRKVASARCVFRAAWGGGQEREAGAMAVRRLDHPTCAKPPQRATANL